MGVTRQVTDQGHRISAVQIASVFRSNTNPDRRSNLQNDLWQTATNKKASAFAEAFLFVWRARKGEPGNKQANSLACAG